MRELFRKCKRRLRFSLLGLLLIVGFTGGFAGYWLQQKREAEAAANELQRIIAAFQAGVTIWDDYLAGCRRYCFEFADVPFADLSPVLTSYREDLEGHLEFIYRAGFAEVAERDRMAQLVQSYFEEAIRWEAQGYPDGER